jgi:hypothetical protein
LTHRVGERLNQVGVEAHLLLRGGGADSSTQFNGQSADDLDTARH